jgi:hypothetical protein
LIIVFAIATHSLALRGTAVLLLALLLLGLDEVVLVLVVVVVICVDDGVDDDINVGVVLELVDAVLELVEATLELVEVVELPTDAEYQLLLWVLLCANARPIRPAKRQLLRISARMVSSVANEIGEKIIDVPRMKSLEDR